MHVRKNEDSRWMKNVTDCAVVREKDPEDCLMPSGPRKREDWTTAIRKASRKGECC